MNAEISSIQPTKSGAVNIKFITTDLKPDDLSDVSFDIAKAIKELTARFLKTASFDIPKYHCDIFISFMNGSDEVKTNIQLAELSSISVASINRIDFKYGITFSALSTDANKLFAGFKLPCIINIEKREVLA